MAGGGFWPIVEPRIVLDEICDPEVEGNKPLELMLVGPLEAFRSFRVDPHDGLHGTWYGI